MKLNNLIMTREDKTKKLVLLKKETYDEFLQEYIRESGAVMLEKDPTKSLEIIVNKLIRHKKFPEVWKVKNQEAPICPKIFAYIKVHKNPISYRPIVEKRKAPTYELEKAISKWCNNILGETDNSTKITSEVLNKIKALDISNNNILTTYDYESLYPSLKLEPVSLYFYRFMLENLPEESTDPTLLREIAHLVCYSSYYRFNGKIFKQTKGIPIGSPMAGILAEIMLGNIEGQILPQFLPSMIVYKRYVDDILIIWKDEKYINDITKALTLEQYGIKLEDE